MDTPDHDDRTNLRGVIRVLRRRRLVLALVLLALPTAALVVSLSQEKKYSASASLLFRDPRFENQLSGASALPPSADPARQAETNVRLVSLDVVAARAARSVGRGLTEDEVSEKVAVEPQGTSDVVAVTATDHIPALAATIANAFAREYVAFRREADRSKIRDAALLVQRRLRKLSPEDLAGGRGQSLQRRADQLDVLASLQTGNAEVVQRAEKPTSPSSPKILRNLLIAVFVALVLGIGLALLLELLDRRVRDPREIGEMFGRPILGVIPQSRAILRASGRDALPPTEAEAFRLLRANLRYFNVDRDIRSVAITSGSPGDGKSTVVWNLACAASTAGEKVLVIEADLRHPVVRERYGPASPGLSQVLAGQVSLDEATHTVAVAASLGHDTAATVSVVPSGPLPPNPTDLIDSETMRSLLTTAQKRYDLLVIDTPPTSIVSDAIPLVTQVSGVMVVARAGRTRRDAISHLQKQLENLHAPLLGVVVNGVSRTTEGYYGYDTAYSYQAAEPVPAGDATSDDGKAAMAEDQPATNGSKSPRQKVERD